MSGDDRRLDLTPLPTPEEDARRARLVREHFARHPYPKGMTFDEWDAWRSKAEPQEGGPDGGSR